MLKSFGFELLPQSQAVNEGIVDLQVFRQIHCAHVRRIAVDGVMLKRHMQHFVRKHCFQIQLTVGVFQHPLLQEFSVV